MNKDNLNDKKLPKIKDFYSSIKLETISEKEYKQTKEIYHKLEFKKYKGIFRYILKIRYNFIM